MPRDEEVMKPLFFSDDDEAEDSGYGGWVAGGTHSPQRLLLVWNLAANERTTATT